MFRTTRSFVQPLNAWNIFFAIDYEEMFSDVTSFDQNLCSWGTHVLPSDVVGFGADIVVTEMFADSVCTYGSAPVQEECNGLRR